MRILRLTNQQIARYGRNIALKQLGTSGQKKLLSSKVLIVGLGGLGSPVALYLAAAGIGTLGLLDSDTVQLTNLQRQVIHNTERIGTQKVDSAKKSIQAINPDVKVETYYERATAENISPIIRRYHFVIDGTDNFPGKFLINDACFFEKVAFSHAGVIGFEGQLMTVLPGKTVCYRCIFNAPPPAMAVPSPAEVGVLGVVPAVIGTLQATEAIKYLLGKGDLLTNTLLSYDALKMEFRKVHLKRNPKCPICGNHPTITKLQDEK
jgi:molybdopterin/thiamine biosynthesis adenylyltransferase